MIDWLESLKDRNLVSRIGISIYTKSDLEGIPLDRFQIVQMPLSIYDQRLFNNGTLDFLVKQGIAVHVRSIFLQGLLLQPTNEWPNFLSSDFRNHHHHHELELSDKGMNLLESCLGFLKSLTQIEAVIVGVTGREELMSIIKAWSSSTQSNKTPMNYSYAWKNIRDLDPRQWPKR